MKVWPRRAQWRNGECLGLVMNLLGTGMWKEQYVQMKQIWFYPQSVVADEHECKVKVKCFLLDFPSLWGSECGQMWWPKGQQEEQSAVPGHLGVSQEKGAETLRKSARQPRENMQNASWQSWWKAQLWAAASDTHCRGCVHYSGHDRWLLEVGTREA